MAQRFVQPVAPYAAPPGLDTVPFSAVPFDSASPATEVIKKGLQYVHVSTKSTANEATAYLVGDACGNEYYTKANVASNINQTIDCSIVSVFQGSLSITVPKDIDAASLLAFVSILVDAAMVEITAVNV